MGPKLVCHLPLKHVKILLSHMPVSTSSKSALIISNPLSLWFSLYPALSKRQRIRYTKLLSGISQNVSFVSYNQCSNQIYKPFIRISFILNVVEDGADISMWYMKPFSHIVTIKSTHPRPEKAVLTHIQKCFRLQLKIIKAFPEKHDKPDSIRPGSILYNLNNL